MKARAYSWSLLFLLGVCAVGRVQPPAKDAVRPAVLPEPVKFEPKPTGLGDESAEVLAVAYSPDRETLATGGADKLIRLWDAAGGKILATLEGHGDAISSLAFSRDGRLLVS